MCFDELTEAVTGEIC